MTSNSCSFPHDPDDPFNQKITNLEKVNSFSWQSNTNLEPVIPKWKIQTAEESKDQESFIQKLEMIPHWSLSDNEEEDSVVDRDHEEEEGLPLLWDQKSNTPFSKKTENQYKRQWFCCYYC
ncbi:uncharacterized protein BX663DRAFT_486442 [Cokeromyces recurvatus]|uniref:uncharacterized protein n=1 Tax=Cokeromyces recurvatus TaxID=90255 RepID=UPI00221F6344|nr:uncharacterized protein BX663DRAFT_486442 [Cokeromyces recurvatus]KAI7902632.1 hypothetical protein BX663DRAFT_486442 [Cokeromyces recurvatus]